MALRVHISSFDGSMGVSAFLPDDFAFSQDHEWENPFKVDMNPMMKSVIEWVSGGKMTGTWDPATTGKFLGIDAYTYMGSSPFSITLELEFVVNDSIEKELRQPIRTLYRMSCPKPQSLGGLGRPDFVHIRIPYVLNIEKAVITSVGATLMKPLVTDGKITLPMKARTSVTLIMSDVLTVERVNERILP